MNRMLYTYGAIVLAAAVGLAGYEWIEWCDMSSWDWAGWFGALATLISIPVAAYTVVWQLGKTKEAERKRAATQQIQSLQGFRELIHEVVRMLAVSAAAPSGTSSDIVLYPDLPGEFKVLADIFLRKTEERDLLSHSAKSFRIRQICIDAMTTLQIPGPKDNFFMKKYRCRFDELRAEALNYQSEIELLVYAAELSQ